MTAYNVTKELSDKWYSDTICATSENPFPMIKDYKPAECKENTDPRNWDKPSKAVICSDGKGNGCILFHCGPHIDTELNVVGRQLDEIGLDDCPEGIWVWEGIYQTIKHDYTDGMEYSTEPVGKFSHPTRIEWGCIQGNICPWDEKDWLKKEEETIYDPITGVAYDPVKFEPIPLAGGEYNYHVNELTKRVNQIYKIPEELIVGQLLSVTKISEPEYRVVTYGGRGQGKTKKLMESVERLSRSLPDIETPGFKELNKKEVIFPVVETDFRIVKNADGTFWLVNSLGNFVQKVPNLNSKAVIKSINCCDCGAEKARTTHSDWCSKGNSK